MPRKDRTKQFSVNNMKTEILQKIAEGILMLSIIGAVLYGVYHFFGLWVTIGYTVSMAIITAFIALDIRNAVENNEPDEYKFDDIV